MNQHVTFGTDIHMKIVLVVTNRNLRENRWLIFDTVSNFEYLLLFEKASTITSTYSFLFLKEEINIFYALRIVVKVIQYIKHFNFQEKMLV